MNKINPMLDYNYLDEFDKFEIICTCSNVFYVKDLNELENKSRCSDCAGKKTKINDEEKNDLILKFTESLNKRKFDV